MWADRKGGLYYGSVTAGTECQHTDAGVGLVNRFATAKEVGQQADICLCGDSALGLQAGMRSHHTGLSAECFRIVHMM